MSNLRELLTSTADRIADYPRGFVSAVLSFVEDDVVTV
jgi:hypothetical protein